jgi:dTDP-4-dehydrorhamnose 3,5-epimerase
MSKTSAESFIFQDGSIDGVSFRSLSPHKDHRGWLIELYREDQLAAELQPVMAYVSETLPGVARGPHEHVDQTDYFAFVGPGEFMLYLWDARPNSPTRGRRMKVAVGESNRQCVIVPPGIVHAYKNVGSTPGWVFNAPNRLYAGRNKSEPVDEIRHEDKVESVYRLD